MIQAKMPDGKILEFPADTADAVVDRVAKEYIATLPPPPSFGRGLGLGVRDAVQGVAALPGLAYDAVGGVMNLPADISAAVGGPSLPRVRTARENIDSILNAVGVPKPATEREKLTSAAAEGVASVIPNMGLGALLQAAKSAPNLARILLANPSTQIAAGVGGGTAGEYAKQQDVGTAGQIASALGGGAAGASLAGLARGSGRLAGALGEPLSEAGRQRIVAGALLRQSSAPGSLSARLAEGLENTNARLRGAVPTLGEVARDPSLLRVESSLRAGAGGPYAQSAMSDADFARTAVRTQAINAVGDNLTPEARGAIIRQGLEGAESGMGARVSQMYKIAEDRNTSRYSVQPVMEVARNATRRFDPKQGGGGVPPELQGVIDQIEKFGRVDITQAQNLRKQLGEIAGEASVAGNKSLAETAGLIRTSLEDTINDPRWMEAVAARRTMGENVGRDATGTSASANILRTDRFGAPMMANKDVPGQVLKSPDAVRQVMRASLQGIDDARTARNPNVNPEDLFNQHRALTRALRGQFVENLMQQAQTTAYFTNSAGNTQRGLSIANFNRFMDDNNRIAQELFEPRQYQQLSRIASDFAEGSMAANTGATRNSQTMQNLSVANMLSRVGNGMLNPDNPTMRQFASLGGLLKIVYGSPEVAMRDMLTRSMTDPVFAQMILARATPKAVQRAVTRLGFNAVDEITRAGTPGLAQQVIRTSTDFGDMARDGPVGLNEAMQGPPANTVQNIYNSVMNPESNIVATRNLINSPQMRTRVEAVFENPAHAGLFTAALSREAQFFHRANQKDGMSWDQSLSSLVTNAVRNGNLSPSTAGRIEKLITSNNPTNLAAAVRALQNALQPKR